MQVIFTMNKQNFSATNENARMLGLKIRAARLQAGLTQKEAAQKAMITQSHLSMLENGIRGLSAEMLIRLCGIYDMTDIPIMESELNERCALQTLALLEELVEKSGSKKLVRSVDNYINLCGYVLLRRLYMTNPHNSNRVFSISDGEIDQLAQLLLQEPTKILSFAETSKEVKNAEIEPDEFQAIRFLEVVRKCEMQIINALSDNEESDNCHC